MWTYCDLPVTSFEFASHTPPCSFPVGILNFIALCIVTGDLITQHMYLHLPINFYKFNITIPLQDFIMKHCLLTLFYSSCIVRNL